MTLHGIAWRAAQGISHGWGDGQEEKLKPKKSAQKNPALGRGTSPGKGASIHSAFAKGEEEKKGGEGGGGDRDGEGNRHWKNSKGISKTAECDP